MGEVIAEKESHHGRPASMTITLPPLGAVFFRNFEPWPEAMTQPEEGSGPVAAPGKQIKETR